MKHNKDNNAVRSEKLRMLRIRIRNIDFIVIRNFVIRNFGSDSGSRRQFNFGSSAPGSETQDFIVPDSRMPSFHAENLAEQLKTVTKAREELSLALALEKGRRQELDQWRQQAEERRRQDLEQWRQETEARSKSLSQAVKVCLEPPSSQCCGSESGSVGSVCIWASWIRIRIH